MRSEKNLDLVANIDSFARAVNFLKSGWCFEKNGCWQYVSTVIEVKK